MPNYPPLFEIRQWIFFIRMTNKDLKHTVEALLMDTLIKKLIALPMAPSPHLCILHDSPVVVSGQLQLQTPFSHSQSVHSLELPLQFVDIS